MFSRLHNIILSHHIPLCTHDQFRETKSLLKATNLLLSPGSRGDSSIPGDSSIFVPHRPSPTLAYKGLSDRSVEVFDNLRQALRVYLRRWGFWASNMSGQVCLVTFSSFWCLSYYVLGNLVPVKYIFISMFVIKEHTLCSWLILKYKLITAYFYSNWFCYVLWGQL